MSLWPQRVSRLDEHQGRAAGPPHGALHLVAGAPSESNRSRCHDPKIVRHLGSDQRFGLGSRSSASARRFFTRCESHHSEWLVERPRMLACALHDVVSRSTWTHRIKNQSGRRRGSRGSDLIFGVSNVMRRRKEWLSLHGANIAARPKARRLCRTGKGPSSTHATPSPKSALSPSASSSHDTAATTLYAASGRLIPKKELQTLAGRCWFMVPAYLASLAFLESNSNSQNVMRKVPTKLFCVTGFGVTAIW